MAAAPVNESDMKLLPTSLKYLKATITAIGLIIAGAIFNLDSGFDSTKNRRVIQQLAMKPNIKENPRNRQKAKRGRKRFFDEIIYKLRFSVERTFAWQDKFRRVVIRWERIHKRHMGFVFIAFNLVNLRGVCGV
jgi:transposase